MQTMASIASTRAYLTLREETKKSSSFGKSRPKLPELKKKGRDRDCSGRRIYMYEGESAARLLQEKKRLLLQVK